MYQKIDVENFISFLKNKDKLFIIKGSKNTKFFGPFIDYEKLIKHYKKPYILEIKNF